MSVQGLLFPDEPLLLRDGSQGEAKADVLFCKLSIDSPQTKQELKEKKNLIVC